MRPVLLFPKHLQWLLAQDAKACRPSGYRGQNCRSYQRHRGRQPLHVERDIQPIQQHAGKQIGEDYADDVSSGEPHRPACPNLGAC